MPKSILSPHSFLKQKIAQFTHLLEQSGLAQEILAIVECLKQFRGILFGYEINIFLDHKNLVNAATLSESQRLIHWRLIIEEFGTNIQHIAGVYNIVTDALIRTGPYKEGSVSRKQVIRDRQGIK